MGCFVNCRGPGCPSGDYTHHFNQSSVSCEVALKFMKLFTHVTSVQASLIDPRISDIEIRLKYGNVVQRRVEEVEYYPSLSKSQLECRLKCGTGSHSFEEYADCSKRCEQIMQNHLRSFMEQIMPAGLTQRVFH